MGLLKTLLTEGFEVIAIAPHDKYSEKLKEMGCTFIPIEISPRGKDPIKELILIYSYWKILMVVKPAILLTFTVKPNIYGSIAAKILGIPTINNIAGLGQPFAKHGPLMIVVSQLYKIALGGAVKIFFQNQEDKEVFLKHSIAPPNKMDRLPGSGIDISKFIPPEKTEYSSKNKKIFLYASRLLWDKGIFEFMDAAHTIKKDNFEAEFHVLGPIADSSRQGPTLEMVRAWESNGAFNYLGVTDNIMPHLISATCLVLPSYYGEGVPRILLEAAALETPIITCYSVGCKDAVNDGETGFLCIPRDSHDLAEKIKKIINLSDYELENMGRKARIKMKMEFDEEIVIKKYLDAIEQNL